MNVTTSRKNKNLQEDLFSPHKQIAIIGQHAPIQRVAAIFKTRPMDNPNVVFLKKEIKETIRFFHGINAIPNLTTDIGLDGDDKKHLTRSRIFKALYRSERMQESLSLAKPGAKVLFVASRKPAAAESSTTDSNKRQRSN